MGLFIAFRMYLQFQRLVLGTDALKKAEEKENSGYSDDEYSVTHSNKDLDGIDTNDVSTESEDTLDEFSNSKKEKFLFEDEYDSNPNQSEKTPISSHTDSSLEDLEASDFEIEAKKKRESKRKKGGQLMAPNGSSSSRKSKKKKKGGIKLNSKIWQTIVLSHSPREDESMLFEEGTDVDANGGDVTIEMSGDKKHNHPHAQMEKKKAQKNEAKSK